MLSIPTFSAERKAGFTELGNVISYASIVQLSEPFSVGKKTLARLKKKVKAENKNQPDLHYLKTILVSTGWNKNDDVFDLYEAWAARHTPEDKPFNYEHNCDDIIGHITSNVVIDVEGEVVTDDTSVDELPDKFHILTGAVLYKAWEKEDLQERMDTIIAEIAEAKWYVSMEALFTNFDYALTNGKQTKIVARNEDTAFLTKHLRAYGGDGVYQEYKVGRLLRNLVFSGKGLVRNPANPESVIITDTQPFKTSKANFYNSFTSLGYEDMNIKNKEELQVSDEVKKLEATINELMAENKKLEAALRDNDTKQLKTEVDELTKQVKTVSEQLKAETVKVDELVKSKKEATDKLAASEKALLEKTDELTKLVAEKTTNERIVLVKEKLQADEETAKKFVAKLEKLDNEQFSVVLDTAAAKFTPAQLPPKSTPAQTAPKATNKPAPMGGKASEDVENDDADANADPAKLPEKKDGEAVVAGVQASDEKVEKVRKAIASYFDQDEDTNEE